MKNKRKILFQKVTEQKCHILEAMGETFDVVLAENEEEFLDILLKENNSISAIVLDFSLGDIGFNLMETIKSHIKLSSIPIIVISDKLDINEEIRALKNGADDFIKFPCNEEILLMRISNVLKRNQNIKCENYSSEIDGLTQIYNRYAFYDRFQNMIIENSQIKYSIILFDIYKFKIINDVYGTVAADKILVKISECIREIADKYNGICAHSYADQFLLGIPKYDGDLKDVLIEIENKVNSMLHKNKVNLKAGVYNVENVNLSVITMCARAKYALCSIKEKYNVNIAEYDTQLRNNILREEMITGGMENALIENQFQVYFQPKYSISCKKAIGAEALVRWVHPKLGLLTPNSFIPIFEKVGFITELDIYVWEECCKFIHNRIKEEMNIVPISINVSRIDILSKNIVNILCDLVSKYDIEPKYLHIEITESAYNDNDDILNSVLNDFKKHGFIIEIDDFGSGYSSLSLLSEIPADILKLDMKFLQNKEKLEVRNKIIHSVIHLADWMGLSVIAEGIETDEQLELLQDVKCQYAQGYYFAKPMPVKDFEELLNNKDSICRNTSFFDIGLECLC